MKQIFKKKAFVILVISGALSILPMAVQGEDIKNSNPVAEFQNTGEVYRFMYSYYANPQPNRLVPALKTVIESEQLNSFRQADEYLLAGFFGCAAAQEPNIIEGYKNLFEPTAHRQRLFILKILQLCADTNVAEYFISQLQTGRFINQQKEIENMLAAGIPMNAETFSKQVDPVSGVYLLLGKYLATGKTNVVDDLISALDFEDANLSQKDTNSVKQYAIKTLISICRRNPDAMTICKQRLENAKKPDKKYLEEVIDSIDGSISAQRIIREAPECKVVTGPKGWALGCCAVLLERNYSPHDTLAARPINAVGINSLRGSLDNWWGIRTKKDLLDALDSLEKGGHRSSFDKTAARVVPLSDEQYKVIADLAKDDKEKLQELEIARKYATRLAGKSILGWDYARYIALCRWGYTIGLLGEQEAWDKIMPIARQLQKRFNSWEDLGCNYLIGRQFWSYKETVKEGYLYEDAFQRLMDTPSSPWNKYPWNMNLSEDANE